MEHVCFLGDYHIQIKRPSKLSPQQCLLQCNLYMKHDNVYMYDFFYGIGKRVQFVIMPFSLHFASMIM
jgi:hypothetical protein